MARTESKSLPMGFKAPDFNLYNPISKSYQSLNELKSDKATVIMFICNHCPFVVHIAEHLAQTASEYQGKGISFIGINSNDVINYPADSPENMILNAQKNGYTFPYLFDETQEVAKAYDAACTPDIYVFDKNLELCYHGQYDGSRPGNNISVTGTDLISALNSILAGNTYINAQIPSIGCNIKWKP
jgi:thiol-disulfide isomerase/thioredoxin